jgi:hypothetical protein
MNYYSTYEHAFEDIADRNERLLWVNKPKLLPYITIRALFALILIAVGLFMYINAKSKGGITNPLFSLSCFLPIAIGAWNIISALLAYPRTFFGYTEKKVLMQTVLEDKSSLLLKWIKLLKSLFAVTSLKEHSAQGQLNSLLEKQKLMMAVRPRSMIVGKVYQIIWKYIKI